MQSYKVFMTDSATRDLKGLSSHIAYDFKEPSSAKKLVEKIKVSVMGLASFPLRHGLIPDDDLATKGLGKAMVDNYIIFYIDSEEDKTVTVVRILYGRRDWRHLL